MDRIVSAEIMLLGQISCRSRQSWCYLGDVQFSPEFVKGSPAPRVKAPRHAPAAERGCERRSGLRVEETSGDETIRCLPGLQHGQGSLLGDQELYERRGLEVGDQRR
jgi:hypothetical protein